MAVGQKDFVHAAFVPVNYNQVLQMFSYGMLNHYGIGNIDILGIFCTTIDFIMRRRLEAYLMGAEHMLFKRGDANVRYAWLPVSKDHADVIMSYGMVHSVQAVPISTYGTGVHLSAASYPHLCARHCAADESGIRRMILCRVTMGNMEPLRRLNNTQTKPSNADYDNGVDNIHDPKCYIVWNDNITSHIFPEFIVSFKVSPQVESLFSGWELRENLFRFNRLNQLPKGLKLPESSKRKVAVSDMGSSSGKRKAPKSELKEDEDE